MRLYQGIECGTSPVILLQMVMVCPGTHLVKSHESQLKKKSLKLKMLWLLCNHTVNPKTDSKTLYYSVLKLKYSHCPCILHCKAQQRRKKCVLLSNSHNNCHRNYTKGIFLQIHMFSRSIFASYRTHAMNYFASLGIFMCQGHMMQR